jgi:CubicO group peptidase (beta-lactamase class C family)
MYRLKRASALLLFLFLISGTVAGSRLIPGSEGTPGRAGAQVTTDPREARVDSLFAELDSPASPGVAVVVVREGEVLLRKGYGSANLEYQRPITPSTVFDIASVSKQFAGMAISMLVEAGAISLEDDVRDYIPELPDFGHTITLDHLVHHTSGLRDWPGTLAVAGWRMDDVIAFDQILDMAFSQEDLNFIPGAEYTYSNTGFNLLAEVVARVTGQTFREWTHENLFVPLEMTNTHFQDDHTEVVPNRAYGYSRGPDGTYAAVPDLLTALGSSSLFTTVDDLAKWVTNFDTHTVGGSSVIERMRSRGVLNDGSEIAYAFGVSIGEYKGRPTVSHGGSWAAFRTYLLHFPEESLGVVVLANHDSFNSTANAQAVADIYLESGPGVQEPGGPEEGPPADSVDTEAPAVELDASLLAEYEGVYKLGPGWYVAISRHGDGLRAQATAEGFFPMEARSETGFWVEGYGASITFLRGDTGSVDRLEYRGVTAPRVGDLGAGSPTSLGEFAGTFFSDELDTEYQIAVEDGALVVHHRRHGTLRFFSAWRDDFRSSAWFIRSLEFTRGEDGAVTGFLINGGERVRNLRFEKR